MLTELLKLPNVEAFLVALLVVLILTFVAGFFASMKLIAIANSAIFESRSTQRALNAWAKESKDLEIRIDERIEHKRRNVQQENIYAEKARLDRDKEIRDLAIGITQRVDAVSSKMDLGWQKIEDKIKEVRDTEIRHESEIQHLKERLNGKSYPINSIA